MVGAACAPPRVTHVNDPSSARRFEILDTKDTTFSFLATGAGWVRAGDAGIAVDPRRDDALVARFVVQGRVADTVRALITGQTARVTTSHVALLSSPHSVLLRERAFWLGVVAGGALGAGAALAIHGAR
jgi:hypothetical protein